MKLSLILTILIFSACVQKELKPSEYLDWAKENGEAFCKVVELGEVRYTAMIRPPEYNLARFINENDTMGIRTHQPLNYTIVIKMEPLDGKTQVLTIGAKDKQEPYRRVNYYLNEVTEDIRLIKEQDTIYPSTYLYERYYNLSPSQSLVSGFTLKSPINNQGILLEFQDKTMNTGKIRFDFDDNQLKRLPKLKIN